MAIPIVFVPGVLGTTLVDSTRRNRRVWGSATGLLSSRHMPPAADGMQGVEPGEVLWRFTVIPRLFGVPVYETLARRLEQAGYRRAALDTPTLVNGLYGLAYDWRQDIVTAARAIETAVARVTHALGVPRVHIVAHSWGCNAVRYFLRYGGADVLADASEAARPGAASVATYFALGPLYGGTWRAVHEAQHGFDVAPGLGVQSHQASTTRCLYQLLPYGNEHALDEDGRSIDVDIADVATWQSRGWGAFQSHTLARVDRTALQTRIQHCLTTGRQVWRLLETASPIDQQVRTITYTVNDQPTLSRLVIDRRGHPLASTEAVKRHAPHLLPLVTANGDQYVTFDQIRRHAPGTELIGVAGCTHRDLYKHESVLSNLVQFAGATA